MIKLPKYDIWPILKRVDFPGGYFDATGGVHWMLTDAIGSVEMVVDSRGSVEQHTGYYPYGEPWRNPAAKERRSYASLNDYDFHARFYTAANALWHAPDSHTGNRSWTSPFTFCSVNPIRRIDPTGKDNKQLEWSYYANGGREGKVYAKLVVDVAVPGVASRLGWWGIAGTVVYERASFATDDFGTDSIIENQRIKHEEYIN